MFHKLYRVTTSTTHCTTNVCKFFDASQLGVGELALGLMHCLCHQVIVSPGVQLFTVVVKRICTDAFPPCFVSPAFPPGCRWYLVNVSDKLPFMSFCASVDVVTI